MRELFFFAALVAVAGCASTPQWRSVGGGAWQLDEGVWLPDVSADASMLVSQQSYTDFYLRVAFFPDKDVNSGVFFRCQNPREITPFNCYEANIWDDHPVQNFRTGAVVEVFSPPLVQVDTVGQWNVMEITAVGRTVTVSVNGEVTASFDSDKLRDGHVALQWGGAGNIRFRDLEVTRL